MSATVLVTGAGGFIGSHLTEDLVKAGQKVRAMVHYNSRNHWGWLETFDREVMDAIEVVPSDITDPFAMRRAVSGCDSVYHLAAQIAIPYSYAMPAACVDTNVRGTLNVLQACRDEGVRRFVHTSTSETYGSAQYVPIDENHPQVGQSPYAASKIAADKLAESFHYSYGLEIATVRPFNTFGPRQSARAVIPAIIVQALSGASEIHLGCTATVRDFNYVQDAVSGFIAVMESAPCTGRVTNIGRGQGVTIGRVAAMILELCQSSARISVQPERVRPEASEVRELVCDFSNARARCGWEPRYSFEAGLQATVDWFRRNLQYYKPNIYNV